MDDSRFFVIFNVIGWSGPFDLKLVGHPSRPSHPILAVLLRSKLSVNPALFVLPYEISISPRAV
jgi:hypothetical protein